MQSNARFSFATASARASRTAEHSGVGFNLERRYPGEATETCLRALLVGDGGWLHVTDWYVQSQADVCLEDGNRQDNGSEPLLDSAPGSGGVEQYWNKPGRPLPTARII